MTRNKNSMAVFITYSIALFISWCIWGNTTNHIWSEWIFILLLLIALIINTAMLYGGVQSDTFDATLLFNIIGIVIFDVFLLASVDNVKITFVSILSYIISGVLALSLIYTVVRYFQHQASN